MSALIEYNGFLYEERFTVNDLDQNELNKVFEIFKTSYERSTGSSWTESKFFDRAKLWVFYGDKNKGFVATRPQRSGPIKLTGVAGSPISAMRGMQELIDSEHKPIWGMASKNIVAKMSNFKFITPPAFLVKLMFKTIDPSVFGGIPMEIQSDGGVKFQYNDTGDAIKYFFANKSYYKWLLESGIAKIDIPTMFKIPFEMFKKKVLG